MIPCSETDSCSHEMGYLKCLHPITGRSRNNQCLRCHLSCASIPKQKISYRESENTYNHVYCELKFKLDDLNEHFLLYSTLLVWASTQRNKGIKILVDVTLVIVRQLLVFVPLYGLKQHVDVDLGEVFRVDKFIHAR